MAVSATAQEYGQPHPVDENSPTAQEEREWLNQIIYAERLMTKPRYRDRYAGFQIVKNLPSEAEDLIISRLPTLSSRPKLLTLEALAARDCKRTTDLVLQELSSLPSYSDGRLIRIIQYTDGTSELMLAYVLDSLQDIFLPRKSRLEQFYHKYVELEVREYFDFCLRQYETGYFRPMFDELWKYNDVGFEVLAKFVVGERRPVPRYDFEDGRRLASQAVADWPFHNDVQKRQRLKDLIKAVNASGWTQARTLTINNLKAALHAAGEEQEDILTTLNSHTVSAAQAERTGDWSRAVFYYDQLARKQMALRNDKEAIRAYRGAIRSYLLGNKPVIRTSTVRLAYYNLACLYSLNHKNEEAVRVLREAYKMGYTDWEWIWRDRDLEHAWDSQPFKEWILELRNDPGIAMQLPIREPGVLPNQ